MTTEEFKKEFEARRLKVEAAIDKYLPAEDTRPSIVHKAMRYSMEAGGKRIRPMLLLAVHDMFPSEIDESCGGLGSRPRRRWRKHQDDRRAG